MKRIQDLAHSLLKLPFLPLCMRSRTDPDLQRALATPSSPTWGNGSKCCRLGRCKKDETHCEGWAAVCLKVRAFSSCRKMLGVFSHTMSFLRTWVTWRILQHNAIIFSTKQPSDVSFRWFHCWTLYSLGRNSFS